VPTPTLQKYENDGKARQAIYNMAKVIAHELGHVLYAIENPLEYCMWIDLIEPKCEWNSNTLDSDKKALFKKFGYGHLLGEPTGIKACDAEKKVIEHLFNNLSVPARDSSSGYVYDIQIQKGISKCDENWTV